MQPVTDRNETCSVFVCPQQASVWRGTKKMMEEGWLDEDRKKDKVWRETAAGETKGKKEKNELQERCTGSECEAVCVLTGASIPQLCLCWIMLPCSLSLYFSFILSVQRFRSSSPPSLCQKEAD